MSEAGLGQFTRAMARDLPDPLLAVREMVRAVRPGGRVILEDDDHDLFRLWPEPEGMDTLWRAYIETYRQLGNDPSVGRRLIELLHAAGARAARNTWLFFGSCSGQEIFPDMVENFARILDGARSRIVATGLVDDGQIDAALESYRAWGRRPDAALWYARCWAEGHRP